MGNRTEIHHHEDMGDGKYLDAHAIAEEDGFTMDIYSKHPEFAQFLQETILEYFDANKGINFVSITAQHEERGQFSVIIQKEGGKTPSQTIGEQRQRIAELEAERSNLLNANAAMREEFDRVRREAKAQAWKELGEWAFYQSSRLRGGA